MNRYSYYTPTKLADEIVRLLPDKKYDSVIDICCGTWNLLSAAYKRYPSARFLGVDIDESIEGHVLDGAEFVLSDGRVFADLEKKKGNTYDLILSNPPFGHLDEYELYWNKNSTGTELSALQCKRYEMEMMLANIYLAHEGSVLVIILPITFFYGETFCEARKQIAKLFSILEIIELPINTFAENKLKTVAIIMERGEMNRNLTNYRKAIVDENKWYFSDMQRIEQEDISNGNWDKKNKGKINLDIRRGRIHSGNMGKGEHKVLHCSSFLQEGMWRPSIRYTNIISNVRAVRGDIIINRIGRGAGYWCVNEIDNVQISDCLFVLKNKNNEIVNKLNDNTVAGKLNIDMRGVSTMYITKADICNLIDK